MVQIPSPQARIALVSQDTEAFLCRFQQQEVDGSTRIQTEIAVFTMSAKCRRDGGKRRKVSYSIICDLIPQSLADRWQTANIHIKAIDSVPWISLKMIIHCPENSL